jgi:RHH-type transcriptional regulator, proline utilization regulon repressor / proline dehydrogenase / delta 1-pyrroline-5-carboxylate dehydrogenase
MATADSISSSDLLYAHIQRAFLVDEGECVAELLRRAAVDAPTAARIRQRAANLVTAVRGQRASGIESFMRQYDLATHEGVLLMCVAEALLRIPMH